MFWDSVRQYYLDDFLAAAWRSEWKRNLVARRPAGQPLVVRLVQMKLESDPLEVVLASEGFSCRVGGSDAPAIRILAGHLEFIGMTSLSLVMTRWFWGKLRLPDLFSRPLDHLRCALIFFG